MPLHAEPSSVVTCTLRLVRLMYCAHVQASQMKHGLSVVADLTKGDAEMQRAVRETVDAFGGLDIIVNRQAAFALQLLGTAFLSRSLRL